MQIGKAESRQGRCNWNFKFSGGAELPKEAGALGRD